MPRINFFYDEKIDKVWFRLHLMYDQYKLKLNSPNIYCRLWNTKII
jgi:hypothetical protein